MSGHALLNVESGIALAFLATLLARSRPSVFFSPSDEPDRRAVVFLTLCAAILLVDWPVLFAPFVFDDYTHITDARNSSWQTILAAFGPVEHKPGLFFRPFGFLVYWLNYRAAGSDPRLWHSASLIFHAVSCCLLFTLCRSLRFNGNGSFAAALLLAVSGVSVEAVAWIDARFDPMAACLVLASLVCVCQYVDSGRWTWIAAACAAGACAMLTKETAFSLPLLAACVWSYRPSPRLIRACAGLAALAGILFVYRWWAIGGIGGYGGRLNLAGTLNGIFVRDWTILFFPINWSGVANPALWIAAAAIPLCCVVLVRIPRRAWFGAFSFTCLVALPAQNLLLIGTDLAQTRVLYMPALGWALLWGAILTAMPRSRGWTVAIIASLICQFLILRHNMAYWLDVPGEARAICASFARTAKDEAVVAGLPLRKNGVVFLANGFPECVAMNSDVPASRVSVRGSPTHVWNPATGQIEAIKR